MIDLTPIEKYLIDDNEDFDDISENDVSEKGFETWFKNQINYWLNCSYMPTGKRLLQTNDKRYNREITTTVHMIENYAENKDYYYNSLINCHFNNLEFEKINGFEYNPYTVGKQKSSYTKKKTKQTSIDFGDKPKKETAAERKLKAHAAKINGLTFTIKPANNDNTL